MNENIFWNYIELAYLLPEEVRDKYEFENLQRKLIKNKLKEHDLKDILLFQKILSEKARVLYSPKIGDVFNITVYDFSKRNDSVKYISTDGFLDFRLWIVCLGKEAFNTFLNFETEEELLKYDLNPNLAYVSGFEYFVNEVYQEKEPHDSKYALEYCDQFSMEFYFDGNIESLYAQMHWNNLNKMYPKLFNRYQKNI